MSKKKASLLKCNNKKYLQYYNIYVSNSTILNSNLRNKYNNNNYITYIKSINLESKIKKSIIKNIYIKNLKKNIYCTNFIYPLFLKKYFITNISELFSCQTNIKFDIWFSNIIKNYYNYNKLMFDFYLFENIKYKKKVDNIFITKKFRLNNP